MQNISKAAGVLARVERFSEFFSNCTSRDSLKKSLEGKIFLFSDEKSLNDNENVYPGTIGSVVDYLTRMVITGDKNKAFEISMLFKKLPFFANHTDSWVCNHADTLLEKITGLDDLSIIRACNLVCFDLIIRTNYADFLKGYNQCANLPPEDYKSTVENIRIMVERCEKFLQSRCFKPVTGFVVCYEGLHGDGDILTDTEIWDIKTSREQLSLADKIQVLLYWYVGLNTKGLDFSKISTLGIYNPRMNYSWELEISQIPEDLIDDLHSICFYPFIV